MKIVVIGGTGLIGSKTVERLRKRGHEVLAASPNSGVNTITGEGLADALSGAQVVIDLANSPSFEDKAVLEFFETSGRNLLSAEAVAGVKHHIALSVVGTRTPAAQWISARQDGAGEFDQEFRDTVHDCPIDPVLRVPGRDCPILDGWRLHPPATGLFPTHRVG